MTQDETLMEILQELANNFPQRPISADTLMGYERMLSDLPVDAVKESCDRLTTRVEWFPTIAAIRSEVVAMIFRPPLAFEAWSIVLKEVRRIGHAATPSFDLPVIEQAVRAVGWREICLSEEIDRTARRFELCYDQMVNRALNDAKVDIRLVMPIAGQTPTSSMLLSDRIQQWEAGPR